MTPDDKRDIQGTTGYGWPWGNELDDSKMPEFTSGNTLPLAEAVIYLVKHYKDLLDKGWRVSRGGILVWCRGLGGLCLPVD